MGRKVVQAQEGVGTAAEAAAASFPSSTPESLTLNYLHLRKRRLLTASLALRDTMVVILVLLYHRMGSLDIIKLLFSSLLIASDSSVFCIT